MADPWYTGKAYALGQKYELIIQGKSVILKYIHQNMAEITDSKYEWCCVLKSEGQVKHTHPPICYSILKRVSNPYDFLYFSAVVTACCACDF